MAEVLPPSLTACYQTASQSPADARHWWQLAREAERLGYDDYVQLAYQQLARLKPGSADGWFALANYQQRSGRYPEALDHYCQALAAEPESPEIRNNLAVLLTMLAQPQLAEALLQEAIALRPDYVEALNNLANLYRDQQQYVKAAPLLAQALRCQPDDAATLTNLGLLYKAEGRTEQAIQAYRQALAQASAPAACAFNYAIALIQSGDYQQGFSWYERRWQISQLKQQRQRYDQRMAEWRGEALSNGQRLLLWCEQGLGDALQMARYLPLLAHRYPEAQFICQLDPSLLRLFRAQAGFGQIVSSAEPVPTADFHCSLMSLPHLQRTSVTRIPAAEGYLSLADEWLPGWQQALPTASSRPRLGIVWQSGQAGVGRQAYDRQARSLPPEALALLLDAVDADWVSLQLGGDPLPEVLAHRLIWLDGIRDFADTAAIVQCLDAVITVDTAVAHLAAALGRSTIVLMSAHGGNLFPQAGPTMPWYHAMQLLRQHRLHDWAPVIAALPDGIASAIRRPEV